MKTTKRCNRRNNFRAIEKTNISSMSIEKYLRRELHKAGWNSKKDTKCYISGRTYKLESHHNGKSFGMILRESLKKLNIEYKPYMTSYDIVELAQLKNEIIKAHKDLKAITLNADIHQALHDRYGRDVTDEQLEEFKAEYQNKQIA